MAKIEQFLPTLLQCEGGFVNDPYDKGGATNRGITLAVYRKYYGAQKTVADLKAIKDSEVRHIYKNGYWDKCKADEITNQSVANIIVDWAVNSGVQTAVKKVQRLLNVIADGVIGPKTLKALNTARQRQLFYDIKTSRESFYNSIVYNNPTQRKFLNGWLNRLRKYNYTE